MSAGRTGLESQGHRLRVGPEIELDVHILSSLASLVLTACEDAPLCGTAYLYWSSANRVQLNAPIVGPWLKSRPFFHRILSLGAMFTCDRPRFSVTVS